MYKQRQLYLKNNPEDRANGYYQRTLSLSFANLNLEIPRVRFGNSFRPALLPPAWKRVDKDYEELLFSMLAMGIQGHR